MQHDVFLSYSARDKTVADAVCHGLEKAGITCWMASRDITHGQNWGGAIVDAIGGSRTFVIIFSAESNKSQQVLREVERALNKGIPIVPFKIEDVIPSSDMEYYLSAPHWLEAMTPPLAGHITRLARSIRRLLEKPEPPLARPAPSAKPRSKQPTRRGEAGVADVTMTVSFIIDLCRYLEHHGVATVDVCRAAGLDPGIVNAPDEHVTGQAMEGFWRAALELSGDPDLGLHAGAEFNPGALNIVGYVLMTCRTVGEVLDKAERLHVLLNDGVHLSVAREGGLVAVRCDTRDLGFSPPYERQAVEITLSSVVRELSLLTESEVRPIEVRFRQAQPATGISQHSRIFGAPIRFDQAEDCLVFSDGVLELPVRSANAALLAVFEQHADALLAQLDRRETHRNRVTRILAEQLKGEAPSVDDVARQLSMSRRDLQRVLREEGTTFQAVLDDTRRELAVRHLRAPGTTVSEVAFLLGFSETGAFHRAFKRWTGVTPKRFRETSAAGP